MKSLKKIFAGLAIALQLSSVAEASKIQQQGIKTASDCTTAGATIANCLPTTAQIYDGANSQQLSVSIANGQIGGGGGSKNYLSNYVPSLNPTTANTGNGNFEKNATTGWSLFNTTLSGGLPTTITAGASSITTFATTATSPLEQKYSLNVASTGALTVGQGFITDAFYIDSEDQTGVMSLNLFYSTLSGSANLNMSATSANTWAFFVYDVTNTTWYQLDKTYGMDGSGQLTGVMQASKTGTQYRIAAVVANASAGASSMLFDGFSFGPQAKNSNANVIRSSMNLTTANQTIGTSATKAAFNNILADKNGAVSISNSRYVVQQQGSYTFSTTIAGLPSPAGNLVIYLYKNGSSIKTSNIYANNSSGGTFTWDDEANVGDYYEIYLQMGSGTFTLYSTTSTSGGSTFDIKKIGNSSSGDDAKVVSFRAENSSGTSIAATTSTILSFPTVRYDDNGGWNSSTNTYTVRVSGRYKACGMLWFSTSSVFAAGNPISLYLSVNSSNVSYLNEFKAVAATTDTGVSGCTTYNLNVNDVVGLGGLNGSSTGNSLITDGTRNYFTLDRISGPSTPSAAQSVNASYNTAVVQSIPSNTATSIIYGTKLYDSNNAYNTSTGVYTAPISGKYKINGGVRLAAANYSAGQDLQLYVYKNGAPVAQINEVYAQTSLTGFSLGGWGTYTLQLNQGDTVNVSVTQGTGSAINTSGVAIHNHFEIERVGN